MREVVEINRPYDEVPAVQLAFAEPKFNRQKQLQLPRKNPYEFISAGQFRATMRRMTTLGDTVRRCAPVLRRLGAATAAFGAVTAVPTAGADYKRLNDSVVDGVYTIQHTAGCTNDVKYQPQLQRAAVEHADDVLDNRNLDGDTGSDGSSVQDRARTAGYRGSVAETVAINPALSISGIEIMNNWYYRPDYFAIMSNCANSQMGVWTESVLDRTVVVAVYGRPAPQ
jgi:uncharacterized protein YkwD